MTFAEREETALGTARGETIRAIARRLGRAPSTVSRELQRNADRRDGRYRATTAHALAYDRASRPKPAKLAVNSDAKPREPSQQQPPSTDPRTPPSNSQDHNPTRNSQSALHALSKA